MNMLLVTSYSFGNRKAEVFQIQEGQFNVEFYENNKLVNKLTLTNVVEAKAMADRYTDSNGLGQTFLSE